MTYLVPDGTAGNIDGVAFADLGEGVPDTLIDAAAVRSQAAYCDVNPVPRPGLPLLLYDATAVFASIRNLFLCYEGGRSRIFHEDYFCGLYMLLQEPFDNVTTTSIELVVFQALVKWEPRITLRSGDIRVTRDMNLPGYAISVTVTVNNNTQQMVFSMPLQ